ncbi:pyocin knob domain-containing protein [Fusicatenibacter saccharivorans]|uniref:pyocin knob domain-containing protein n=1 Tax=Fusicatenibacter saccharivorans TaxID=1150298 RepID=UPI0034A2DBDC
MASDKMLGSFDQKSAPEDNDLLVEYDASASKVKNVKFGGVWNWIVKKLTSAVINELQTSSKNVVGAINELNSNTFLLSSPTKKLDGIDLNEVTVGIYAITAKCLNAPPVLSKGTLIVSTPENADYIRQIYIGGYNNDIYSRVRYYNNSTSKFEWREWKTIIADYI